MTRSEFRERLVGVAPDQQALLIARLLYDATMAARGTYEPGTDAVVDPRALRIFNEANHRLANQLRHLLEGRGQRYPDEMFADLIWTHFEAVGFSPSSERSP
jgi:hypothetical protein